MGRRYGERFDDVVDLEVIVCRFDFAGVSNNSSGISFKKRDGRFACERILHMQLLVCYLDVHKQIYHHAS
jgi:hypothetical protein